MINDELKYSTLYDHYKETVSYLKNDLNKRDKLTLYILLLLLTFFLIELKPSNSVIIANKWLENKMGFAIDINYNILITAILLFILGVTVKYFQICLNIEKQYNYIHSLENKMNSISIDKLITREGYSYLKEYPLLSALIHRLYNFLLPIGLILAMTIKVYQLYKDNLNYITITNIFIGILVIVFTCLYLLFVHREIKFVESINKIMKKIFVFIHLYKDDD